MTGRVREPLVEELLKAGPDAGVRSRRGIRDAGLRARRTTHGEPARRAAPAR
ncbi:hypothetical protein [Streptomyces prasinus]|uniref:hypothetical protein n=1 Tax=Streptomyces prasinus TaxID=67345 RepID=UPI0033A60AE2